MSVLIPESGLGSQTLTKSELEEVLKLKADSLIPDDEENVRKPSTSLLQEIVEAMRRGQSIRPNLVTQSCQTDEGEEGLSLDDKLKKIDLKYMSELTAEKVMPYKVLEERMVKYKRECDERARREIESEVARVRDIEISHVRLEEAASYRAKIAEFRNEIDSLHKEKIKELKVRENEIIERCKIKEREIEAAAFEHRQKVLQDLETLRFKELDSKKTVEMELLIIKNEREKLMQKEKEADLKLKDLNLLKISLEKKSQADVDDYRRKVDSQREDERREIQVRRMQLEEDEHRFELNKQKFLNSEKDKTQLEKENLTLKDKLDKIESEHDKMSKEYYEIKDQLKAFSTSTLRDNELINAKTSQAETYENEARTLKQLLEAQKDQLKSEKDTHKEIVDTLTSQIKMYKDEVNSLKHRYSDEIERVVKEGEREKDSYKNLYKIEQSKMKNEIEHLNRKVETEQHLAKELTIVNDKLMKEQSNIRNRYQIDEIEKEAYIRGDVASFGVRNHDFLTSHGIPLIEGNTDLELGEEFIERQKAWNDLDTASRDVKRNINKIGLISNYEPTYIPSHYDIEKDKTPLDDYEEEEEKDNQTRFNTFSAPKEEPKPKKQSVDYDEIDRIERERERERDRKAKDEALKRDQEKRRQDLEERQKQIDLERQKKRDEDRQKQQEQDRLAKLKQEETKSKSTPAPAATTNTGVSNKVLNPFAKKMAGGAKKPDPVFEKPATTYSGGWNPPSNDKHEKKSSDGIEDHYDNFQFGFDDKKVTDEDSIPEDVSEEYSF